MFPFRRFATLTAVSILTAALAYLQSRVLVQILGAGEVLDSYYLATAIPMAVMTMIGVAGNSLLVPVLAANRGTDGRVGLSWGVRAWAIGIVVVGITVSAVISRIVGFWPGPVVSMPNLWLWLLAAGSAAYGASTYAQAILIAEERAVWFAWAQALSFAVFIAVLLLASVRIDIMVVSALYCLSGFAQLALATAASHTGPQAAPLPRVHVPDFSRHAGRAVLDVALVVVFMQTSSVVDRWFAGQFHPGFVTAYSLADKIVQVVVATLAVTIGTTVFPRLLDRGEAGSQLMGDVATGVLAVLAPVSSVFVLFPDALVGLAYGGGQFSGESVATTANLLRLLGLGLVPMGLVFTLPRRLQAVGRYRTQAVVAGLLLGTNVLLKVFLTRTSGSDGVALATSVSYAVAAAVYLGYLLKTRLASMSGRQSAHVAVVVAIAVMLPAALRWMMPGQVGIWVPLLALAAMWTLIGAILGRSLYVASLRSSGRAGIS